tara:strand:+ start:351 stop:791 length:441 start_codon:yes stop_codon:yes gene_type:complete
MKYLVLITLFLNWGHSFCQKCIDSFVGVYHVDIEATMPFFEKVAYAEQGVLDKEFEQTIYKARLTLTSETLTLSMSGTNTTISYSSRNSVKENGTCDLMLDLSEMGVPEEAKDMYLTVYRKDEGRLQIINSVEPKEMDNYIWSRME